METRWWSILLLGMVLFIVFAVARSTTDVDGRAAIASSDPDAVYLALGDSVAAGVGASPPEERGYAALLANRLDALLPTPVRLINLAIPGETTASMLSGGQLEQALTAIAAARRTGVPVEAVTVTIGANDLLRAGSTPTEREAALRSIAANMETILERLHAALSGDSGAPVADIVVTGYYDPTETPREVVGTDGWWLARLDATLLRQATSFGAMWVNVAAIFAGRSDEFTWYPRDIHPTEEGHAAIADAIWSVLEGAPSISIRDSKDRVGTDRVGAEGRGRMTTIGPYGSPIRNS